MGERLLVSSDSDYSVTAVVLSGGASNNFSTLTEEVPKALLKVCGRTLLYHILRNLTVYNFKETIVITNDQTSDLIKEEVDSSLKLLETELESAHELTRVTVHGLSQSEDGVLGTTDVIAYISNFLDNDFVILPCDLYGFFDFKSFLDFHFKNLSLCTIALLNKPSADSFKSKPCLGGNDFEDWSFKYRVVTTLDENTNSLLGISNFLAVENGEGHQLYKWHLTRHLMALINRNLVDVHVYAFSKNIFKAVKSSFLHNSSIRLDLIPYLVKMQHTPFLEDLLNGVDLSTEETGTYKRWKLSETQDDLDTPTGVFYYLGSGDTFRCSRINSIDSLYLANIQACFSHKDKSGKKNPKLKNVLVGLNTNLSESSELKNSVIGNNVSIGNKVKITDCVIMDNCKVGDNTVLDKSVVGFSVHLEGSSNIKNCIIKSGTLVPSNTSTEKDYIPSFI